MLEDEGDRGRDEDGERRLDDGGGWRRLDVGVWRRMRLEGWRRWLGAGLHTVGRSGWGSMPSMASAETNLPVLVEKKMTTHSSILAWKIPWTEEPGRLQSVGSLRVGQN